MGVFRGLCLTALAGAVVLEHVVSNEEKKKYLRVYNKKVPLSWAPESRERALQKINQKKYDLVIIGGGSAGAGCLLDAATRGYSVLLLEREDFASGTSSKSTKLIHGGIRYLEKAIKEVDYKQLSLVLEGLRERKSFLQLAPYLTREVGILLPIKHRLAVPYFWLGTKVYDWLAGGLGIQKSYFISKQQVQHRMPSVDYTKLAGGMIYFDGQMDDSRVNTMLIETAVLHGAQALNYSEVTGFKKVNKKIAGVLFTDKETGEKYTVECSGVINATGPFSDAIRTVDNPETPKIIMPSVGVHLVMPGSYTGKFGMLNPSTKNGSVLFMLPWRGFSIVGTTDVPATKTETPAAEERDVNYLVEQMSEFVDMRIRPKAKNILSAWGGLRPLTLDRTKSDSTSIVRSHLIEKSESDLLTISGGKWTSYREMAEETITECARIFKLPQRKCVTRYIRLIGSHEYSRTLSSELGREFGVPDDIAAHLVSTYGDRARKVCIYANGNYKRIDEKHPYITAEIPYTIDHEHVRKVADYLGRRSLFAYFNVRDAHAAVRTVSTEFTEHRKWTKNQRKIEETDAYTYLDTMGYSLLRRMEQKEKVFGEFSNSLRKICNNSVCPYSSTTSLIKKSFGSSVLQVFKKHTRKDKSLEICDVIKTIKIQVNVLE